MPQHLWWFYILRCSDSDFYYGSTGDIRCRLIAHHKGQVRSTKDRRPLKFVYFEIYNTASKAREREKQFKRDKPRKEKIEGLIRRFKGFELSAPELPNVKL